MGRPKGSKNRKNIQKIRKQLGPDLTKFISLVGSLNKLVQKHGKENIIKIINQL